MKKLAALSISLVFIIGCSDVEFSPIPEQKIQRVVDPIIEPVPPPKPPPVKEKLVQDFVQSDYGLPLDIIVVVDNSSSMIDEQYELGNRMQNFLAQITDVDWQIAITTTDVSNSQLYGLKGEFLNFTGTQLKSINKNTPNYNELFLKTVFREESYNCDYECPSTAEQPLKAVKLAMEKSASENSFFFRENADLAVFILSDEDETKGKNFTSPQSVLSTFQNIWPNKNLTTYAVIVEPGDNSCFIDQGEYVYGSTINSLVQLTAGSTSSICAPDYSDGLEQMGKKARKLLDFVQLDEEPEADSIEVYVDEEVFDQWHLAKDRIMFDEPPKKGQRIRVRFHKKGKKVDKDKDESEDDPSKKNDDKNKDKNKKK